MWLIYAATLLGRVVGHWRGRRAAYLSIAGFCVMLVTLSAGALSEVNDLAGVAHNVTDSGIRLRQRDLHCSPILYGSLRAP